jgi:shikimate kinase
MKNIALIGFMGAGKTAVGKQLAKKLNLALIDADAEIEKEQGMSITDIFKNFGEPHFRDVETAVIKRLSAMKNIVISTGGGAVLRQENMDNLRANGVIVCLWAEPETVFQRIRHDTSRPLLQVEDPLKKIQELLEFRKPFYEKADIMIDTEDKSPKEVADEIIEKVKGYKQGGEVQ